MWFGSLLENGQPFMNNIEILENLQTTSRISNKEDDAIGLALTMLEASRHMAELKAFREHSSNCYLGEMGCDCGLYIL